MTELPLALVSRPSAICERPLPAVAVVVAEISVFKRTSHGSLLVINNVSLKAPAPAASYRRTTQADACGCSTKLPCGRMMLNGEAIPLSEAIVAGELPVFFISTESSLKLPCATSPSAIELPPVTVLAVSAASVATAFKRMVVSNSHRSNFRVSVPVKSPAMVEVNV